MEDGSEIPTVGSPARSPFLNRHDLAVPPFIFAGFGAAFVSLMTTMVIGFNSDVHPGVGGLIAHYSALLFFPAFLVALMLRRWASIPLWSCCFLLFLPALLHPKSLLETNRSNIETVLEVIAIPALTQIARFIRGSRPEERVG